jgi:Zn-dependent protease with chaperone function
MESPNPLLPSLAAGAGVMIFFFCVWLIAIAIATIWIYHIVKWLNWIYRPKPIIPTQAAKPPDYEAEAAEVQRKLAEAKAVPMPPDATEEPDYKYGPK